MWADNPMPGQVKDTDDGRPTGFDDTICPVDFTETGQISSETVSNHRAQVQCSLRG